MFFMFSKAKMFFTFKSRFYCVFLVQYKLTLLLAGKQIHEVIKHFIFDIFYYRAVIALEFNFTLLIGSFYYLINVFMYIENFLCKIDYNEFI